MGSAVNQQTNGSNTDRGPIPGSILGPGPHNDITDVTGITVGQAHDERINTGVTVILPTSPAIAAGDVRGGGPGTRETDLLDPSTLVERADAIVLSGGSSYGLGAADGVAAWLGARGRGFQLIAQPGVPPSPIVPAAILYDLANGGEKNWRDQPPYASLAKQACENAGDTNEIAQGRAGAGFGARAGDGIGGIGSSSFRLENNLTVGALIAVNSFGSPRMPNDQAFWAWPFEIANEFGGRRPKTDGPPAADIPPDTKLAAVARANTTIGVVAVDTPLTKADARRLAIMAQDGLARAIRPIHAPTDGDVLFALSTAQTAAPADPLLLTRLGLIAADCVARAVARAVFFAEKQSA